HDDFGPVTRPVGVVFDDRIPAREDRVGTAAIDVEAHRRGVLTCGGTDPVDDGRGVSRPAIGGDIDGGGVAGGVIVQIVVGDIDVVRRPGANPRLVQFVGAGWSGGGDRSSRNSTPP